MRRIIRRMSATAKTELTRQQLYEQVWATPVRVLAQRYELSDVGLAKICKRYDIPRPPVGYWAKLEHGKKVAQPKLPPPPAGVGEVVVILPKPPQEAAPTTPEVFFDQEIGELARRLRAGELVAAVARDLRGCSAITRQTRDAIEIASRKPTRDHMGILQYPRRYELPHLEVSTSREQRQRALLVIDAIVKTFDAIGCKQKVSRDDYHPSVTFEFRGFAFRLRVRERTKRVPHVLTNEEKQRQAKYGSSLAAKHDYEHTGELYVELMHAQWNSTSFQIMDGKRAGQVEARVLDVAIAVLVEADRHLKRLHDQRLEDERRIEQQRREREEAEQRRIEQERRQAELDCQNRLIGLSDDWRTAANLTAFLAEVEHRLAGSTLDEHDRDLLERWLRWGSRVIGEVDPFGQPLGDLPEVTHPGIKERERREREAAARQPPEETTGAE